MRPQVFVIAGIALLVLAWAGPLPRLVPESFTAHMGLHMLVVAIAAPVLAMGLARPVGPNSLALPLIASVADLVIVWLWHLPALHHASRTDVAMLVLEQASFASVALLLWVLALSGPPLIGALTLFFTSMHMTLLGALLGLAPQPLYAHHAAGALDDQHIGGVLMLGIGGAVYLAGGLWLAARALRISRP
jgi:putative membrane protein